jgi:hypothetical protein
MRFYIKNGFSSCVLPKSGVAEVYIKKRHLAIFVIPYRGCGQILGIDHILSFEYPIKK